MVKVKANVSLDQDLWEEAKIRWSNRASTVLNEMLKAALNTEEVIDDKLDKDIQKLVEQRNKCFVKAREIDLKIQKKEIEKKTKKKWTDDLPNIQFD